MTDNEVRAHPITSASSDGLTPPPEDLADDASSSYTGMDNGETGEDTGYPVHEGDRGTGGVDSDAVAPDRREALEATIGHRLVDEEDPVAPRHGSEQ